MGSPDLYLHCKLDPPWWKNTDLPWTTAFVILNQKNLMPPMEMHVGSNDPVLCSAVWLGHQGKEEQPGNVEICNEYHKWQKVASCPTAAAAWLCPAQGPTPEHQPKHGGG